MRARRPRPTPADIRKVPDWRLGRASVPPAVSPLQSANQQRGTMNKNGLDALFRTTVGAPNVTGATADGRRRSIDLSAILWSPVGAGRELEAKPTPSLTTQGATMRKKVIAGAFGLSMVLGIGSAQAAPPGVEGRPTPANANANCVGLASS